MAIVKNDPFPGVDYTKYQEWEKVVLPSGEVLYTVPGNPAYVFDPVASNATGRKVFRRNPKEAIAEQQAIKEQQQKAIDQQQFNQSPVGQLLPLGASIGGLYVANQLASGGVPSLGGLFGGGAATTAAAPEVAASAAPVLSSAAPAVAGEAATAAPGLFSGLGSVGVLPLAGIAAGTYLGGQAAYDMFKGKTPSIPGRVVLGMATGGLSELARPFLGHKSTRDVAREHTSDLMDAAEGDQNAMNYVQGMREQFNSAPPDPSKPFMGGKYSTFDEYKTAGLDARDLSGVYGNLDTYGAKEWANLTQDQREAITKKNIEAGNYDSKKGEVIIKDKDLAKKLKDETLGVSTINKGPAQMGQVPQEVIDAAAKNSLQPKWIRRNGQIVKVA